ncbi:LacI family transcriptional regulator [Microbacterium sp. 8M]|nr:LacI family transcriptional regulator [Microbacterium sp. 8M]
MSQSPTMNDVARVAQVALKTVSRYVNGATNIDPVLSKRIGDAIEELGYRRNLAAASIRPGWTSRMVGLIISDLANPYYSTLARAIEEILGAEGYMLIVASSEEDGEQHDRLVNRLIDQRVDGLIIVPPQKAGRDWSRFPPPIPPLVFLDRPGAYERADTVLADDRDGAAAATNTLLDAGARRIAFVGDSRGIYTMQERFHGYAAALEARGIPVDDALVQDGAHTGDHAARIVGELLDRGEADAVFAANNRASIGALFAFRERGRELPLVGFDDFEAAPLNVPAVTVATPDLDEMGRTAARLLLARLRGSDEPALTERLPVDVVLRGSQLPR